MELKKITEADLQGVGVVGMEDTPNLSALEMQKKVEEVVREVVIPVLNANVDATASKEDLRLAVFNAGAGDMRAESYDSDLDGVVNSADNGFFTYIHTKSGSMHNLTGNGDNIKFLSTASYSEGDSFKINGIKVTAQLISGENLPDDFFKSGVVVNCFRNGDSINFNAGGAGNILNFKVVGGTSQPASPVENTVWVNTATAISGYTVSGSELPVGITSEGWVHITAQAAGTDSMNILKKNGIYMKMSHIYQYQNGKWNRKEAYICKQGQWQQLSAVIITVYPGQDVTTMFTANTGVVNGFSISRTAYEEGYGMVYITVNLTGVKEMTVTGSLGDCCGICLSATLPQANANPGALSICSQNSDTGYKHNGIWIKTNWDTEKTISVDETFDVTAYSGNYYLILALYGSHTGRAATKAEITTVTTI